MGKRNRERRREKQRKRGAGAPGGRQGGQVWPPRHDPGCRHGVGDSADELVMTEATVLAAAGAFADGDDEVHAELLDRLRRPGASVRAIEVARVIERMADQALAAAWDSGWQPADVERQVRRTLRADRGRALVAAIVHQHRRYAAATVAPGWRAQLRDLGADPWGPSPAPGSGALPLDDVGPADPQAMVEVLSVLLWLPRLPRLGPLPGQARSSPPAAGGRPVDGRVLERVRAMLAKAESTTFAEEAEAFTAKAQELMARHALDRAMVEGADADPGQGPVGRRISVDDPYAQPKSLLLAVVADANRCRAVWSKDMGFSTVFGHESDLDGVDLLYTSLLVQATAAMAAEGRRTDRSGRSRTRSFRSSFLAAYAQRIGQRLRESTHAAEAAGAEEHGAGLLPVLAARSRAVDDAVGSTFPEMGRYSVSISNGAGWAAGAAAAELARLSPHEAVPAGRASA